MKQIMAALWSFIRAAIELLIIVSSNLPYSIPHKEKCRTEVAVSRNLQNTKNHFIEAKICKNIRISDTTLNSVSTSTWVCAGLM